MLSISNFITIFGREVTSRDLRYLTFACMRSKFSDYVPNECRNSCTKFVPNTDVFTPSGRTSEGGGGKGWISAPEKWGVLL